MSDQQLLIGLLGKVEVGTSDGRHLTIPGRRSMALLACLADPECAWTRERLAALLWPGRGVEQARASLRQELLRLRRALELTTCELAEQDGVLRLAGGDVEIDLRRFRAAAADPCRHQEAVDLYRGEFLQDMEIDDSPFGRWLFGRRQQLHALAIACAQSVLRRSEAADQPLAEQAARRLLALDPCAEEAHRWLIRMHVERRDLGRVLEQFRSCADALRLRHGAEPSAETQALLRQAAETLSGSSIHGGLPDKPSIAVLPFLNLSRDPEQAYFADGMVEEIITALSRIRWLCLIARNSSFAYRGQNIDVKQIGHELGVRYVLEGSVRRAGDRIRISSQLADAQTGAYLWADRYEGSLQDVFELQDKVAVSVAGAIEPALEAAEMRRSAARPTNDLTAHDLYLRAMPHILSWEKDRIIQAISLLDQAVARDPDFGVALAYAACCRVQLSNNGWAEDDATNRRIALELARRALAADPDDPIILGNVALVRGFFNEDIDAAIALVDRSLQLNPSFALGWQWSGYLRLLKGELDTAVAHFETCMRLSPSRDRWSGGCLVGIGIARFFAMRFDEAIQLLSHSLEELPSFASTYRFLAAAYAHLGRWREASTMLDRLRQITPNIMVVGALYRDPAHRQLYLRGIKLAAEHGLPAAQQA